MQDYNALRMIGCCVYLPNPFKPGREVRLADLLLAHILPQLHSPMVTVILVLHPSSLSFSHTHTLVEHPHPNGLLVTFSVNVLLLLLISCCLFIVIILVI